jgi:hypothetical protein
LAAEQVESTFSAKSTFREEVEETDPFGEPFKQTWPFTPFKIKVRIRVAMVKSE